MSAHMSHAQAGRSVHYFRKTTEARSGSVRAGNEAQSSSQVPSKQILHRSMPTATAEGVCRRSARHLEACRRRGHGRCLPPRVRCCPSALAVGHPPKKRVREGAFGVAGCRNVAPVLSAGGGSASSASPTQSDLKVSPPDPPQRQNHLKQHLNNQKPFLCFYI